VAGDDEGPHELQQCAVLRRHAPRSSANASSATGGVSPSNEGVAPTLLRGYPRVRAGAPTRTFSPPKRLVMPYPRGDGESTVDGQRVPGGRREPPTSSVGGSHGEDEPLSRQTLKTCPHHSSKIEKKKGKIRGRTKLGPAAEAGPLSPVRTARFLACRTTYGSRSELTQDNRLRARPVRVGQRSGSDQPRGLPTASGPEARAQGTGPPTTRGLGRVPPRWSSSFRPVTEFPAAYSYNITGGSALLAVVAGTSGGQPSRFCPVPARPVPTPMAAGQGPGYRDPGTISATGTSAARARGAPTPRTRLARPPPGAPSTSARFTGWPRLAPGRGRFPLRPSTWDRPQTPIRPPKTTPGNATCPCLTYAPPGGCSGRVHFQARPGSPRLPRIGPLRFDFRHYAPRSPNAEITENRADRQRPRLLAQRPGCAAFEKPPRTRAIGLPRGHRPSLGASTGDIVRCALGLPTRSKLGGGTPRLAPPATSAWSRLCGRRFRSAPTACAFEAVPHGGEQRQAAASATRPARQPGGAARGPRPTE